MTVSVHRHPEDSDIDTSELVSQFQAASQSHAPFPGEFSHSLIAHATARASCLEEAIAEYLRLAECGLKVETSQFVNSYPHWSEQLLEFIRDHQQMNAIAGRPQVSPVEYGMTATGRASESTQNTMMHPLIPALPFVIGDYELQDVIANGGMGIVYRAKQRSLDRWVALKMLLGAQDPARFRAEAEAAAGLEHPQIVAIYEIGQFQGVPFYSMQYIDGVDLRQHLRQGPLSPRTAAGLVQTLAEVIEFAHQRGVLHRDLKPGNVLVDSSGQPFVTDFGLAKRVYDDKERTGAGALLGTPSYMAPEQAAGDAKSVTTAIDVYGLGAILYAVLTGRAPFTGEHSLQVIWKVTQELPLPPRLLVPDIPRDLEMICLKCLEKKPQDRYASAAELKAELGRFLGGFPVQVRPVTMVERMSRWCQRNPIVAGLTGAVVGLLIVAAIGGTTLAWREYRARKSAEVAQSRERRASQLALSNLVNSYTNNGRHAQTNSRQAEAVLWYAAAAELAADAEQQYDALVRVQRRQRFVPQPILATQVDGFFPNQISYHPQGRYIVLADQEDRLYFWDLASESQPRPQSWLPSVSCHAWSTDGNWLALANRSGQLVVVDVASGDLMLQSAYAQGVVQVVFDPSNLWLFVATGDQLERVRLSESNPHLSELHEQHFDPQSPDRHRWTLPGDLIGLSINRDGSYLLAELQGGLVALIDSANTDVNLPISAIDSPKVTALAESKMPAAVFWGNDKFLIRGLSQGEVFETKQGQKVSTLDLSTIFSFDSDSQNRWAALGQSRSIQILNLSDQQVIDRFSHREPVTHIDFHPQRPVVAAGSLDGRVALWELETGRLIGDLTHQNSISSVSFAPDGQTICTIQRDGLCRVWQLNPSPVTRWSIPTNFPATWGKVSSHRNYWFTVGHFGNPSGNVGHADSLSLYGFSDESRPLREFKFSGRLLRAAMSADEKWMAAAIAKDVKQDVTPSSESSNSVLSKTMPETTNVLGADLFIWDVVDQGAEPIRLTLPAHALDLVEQPGGTLMAAVLDNGQTWLINLASGQVVRRLSTSPKRPRNATETNSETQYSETQYMVQAEFSPDGQWLAIFGLARPLELYCQENNWSQQIVDATIDYSDAEFAPDSQVLALVDGQGDVLVWDLKSAKWIGKPLRHDEHVFRVHFDPSGARLSTACADNYARIFDWRTGELACQAMPQRNDVYDAVFSPDGRVLYTVGDNGLIVMWSTHDGGFVDQFPVSGSTGRASFIERAAQLEIGLEGRYLLVSGWRRNVDCVDIGCIEPELNVDLDDLIFSCELAACQRIEHGGVVPLSTRQWLSQWQAHRSAFPNPSKSLPVGEPLRGFSQPPKDP